MIGKYQEAIDLLNSFVSEEGASCDQEELINAVRELQELLYNFQDCRNELCLSCDVHTKGYINACSNCRWSDEQ